MEDSIYLKAALTYARRGWAVFPCNPRDKRPLADCAPNGVLDATSDAETIRGWWARFPDANVAIAAGKSGLAIVDEDGQEGAASLVTWQTENGPFPETPIAYTGSGGRHFLFRAPDGVYLGPQRNVFGPGSKVDSRAGESYVVAPPSVHPNGKRYEWDKEAHPAEVVPAKLPAALLARLRGETERRKVADIPDTIYDGEGREDALVRFAGLMRRGGATEGEILAALERFNEDRIRPPKPHIDLERISRSVARYDPEPDYQAEERTAIADLFGSINPPAPVTAEQVETRNEDGPAPRSLGFSLTDLMALDMPPIQWAAEGILPQGLTILAGKPKIGKSWLALGLVLAVSTGKPALGHAPTEAGAVLYLALEDSARRLQDRLRKMLQGAEPPENAWIYTEWPPNDQGGLVELENWLKAHPDARLVIIDTLQRVRPPASPKADLYRTDYAAIEPFVTLAGRYNVAIVVVHHLRKLGAEDPLDQISGTTGLSGAADTLLVLTRQKDAPTAKLYLRGRDVNEAELTLTWDGKRATWRLGEPPADVTEGRAATLAVLAESGIVPMGPADVADALHENREAVRKRLSRMVEDGLVVRVKHGLYKIKD
jgi:hypothetical protein